MEKNIILRALEHSDGVVSQAARLLRLNRTTLIEKMRKLHIRSEDSL
jgi:DNA-binding NtrC family response regulator